MIYWGVIIILVANYLQIAEEWKQRGLTDTSYRVILLLCAGPSLVAKAFYDEGQLYYTAVFGLFAGAALLMGWMKLKAHVITRYRLTH